MIDYTGYSILGESGDGVAQIIIYLVVGAIVVLGNISKARAQQKRTPRTDVPRPKPKPSGQPLQRSETQASSPPEPGQEKTERSPKYYAPGGFAEALLDEALEKTLQNRSKRKRSLEFNEDHDADREPIVHPMESIEGTEVMARDLESMGHLETLDSAASIEEDSGDAIGDLISFDGPDDLARAVVYAEILSKPVGLRDL